MKIAVLISFSGQGGVERMVMNLVREMAKYSGIQIDLLLIRASGPHLIDVPPNVNVIRLNATHTLTAIPELYRYLKDIQPSAMLVAKDRAGRAALIARLLSRVNTRIVIRLGTNLSTALASKNALQRWLRIAPMKKLYQWVDMVVGVSEGVRADTVAITGMDAAKTTVIRNPVISEKMLADAQLPIEHDWLKNKTMPVMMGVGRLSYQKNFHSLLRAFSEVRAQQPSRLIILGDGKDQAELEALAQSLGVADHVDLVGFQANPYNWLANADVFVLSSRWEGSPNVLTEALALGVPSVAARCPSGPDEVLNEGEYGPLVEVDNDQQLTEAILAVMANPLPAAKLKQAVEEYRPAVSAKNYLTVLGFL